MAGGTGGGGRGSAEMAGRAVVLAGGGLSLWQVIVATSRVRGWRSGLWVEVVRFKSEFPFMLLLVEQRSKPVLTMVTRGGGIPSGHPLPPVGSSPRAVVHHDPRKGKGADQGQTDAKRPTCADCGPPGN